MDAFGCSTWNIGAQHSWSPRFLGPHHQGTFEFLHETLLARLERALYARKKGEGGSQGSGAR
ncbi:hypothetical protein, partial [Pseudomonas aeruginosa]|uniref:hypothetical protein n=1 Tax=Pseudomonas aeruginosa TaxID=287 RepID=UPI001CFFF0BB